MSTTFHPRHFHGVASSRPIGKARRTMSVPTEADVVREIGTVLIAMLAIAFVVNVVLRVFGID